MGSDVMDQNIPPPPPGFVLEGSGGSAPPAAAPMRQAAAPRQAPAYQGVMPERAEDVFKSMVAQESGGRAGVRGPMTAYGQALGRTQMLPATAREMAQRVGVPFRQDLLTGTSQEASDYQDRLGLEYLREGFERTGNARDALKYYHGGPDRSLWGPKTNAYAEEVLGRYGGSAPSGEPLPAQDTPVADMPPPPEGFVLRQPDSINMDALAATQARPGESEANPFVITEDTPRELQMNLPKGTWISGVDAEGKPYTAKLAGQPYINQNGQQGDRATDGGNYLHEVDGMDALRAFSTAAGEQIPGLDEAAVGITAAFDPTRNFSQVRDNYRAMQAVDNQTNRGARDLGGVAGAGLTLAAPGGGFVNAGRTSAAQVGRAGLLGAGYGAAFGAGNTEGDLGQRAEGALWGAGLGAATGGAMQGLSGVLGRSSARAAAAPLSDARMISQMGVDLTPGQMAGGFLKRTEDALTSVPILGDSIRAAQRRGLETFDNTAINRALEPIGATLDQAQSAGRGGMVAARSAERNAYQNALASVSVDAADPALASSLTALRRSTGLTKDVRSSLNSTLDNILEQAQGVVDGDTWKRVDSQLAAAARAAGKGADSAPEKAVLAQRLTDARTAWRDLLGRSDQAALDAVSQADAASAALRIVRKASSDVGSATRNGDASPQTLNRAVAAGGSDGGAGYSQGSRLLQDLTDPAMRVLPSSVPDSGTALRSMFTLLPTLATGAGAGAVGVPGAALGTALLGSSIAVGSAAYSRPMIGLLNRAYRAKSPGAVRGVIADAERLAAENPAGVQAVLQALSPSPLAEQAQLRERLNRPGGGLLATQGQTQPSLLSQ